MSNKKVGEKQHAFKDAIVWRNVTQYLVSKGYFRLSDQIAFLGVSSEYQGVLRYGHSDFYEQQAYSKAGTLEYGRCRSV